MRLLHTSDWHLGRTLHGLDLHAAQTQVLQQICRLVAEPPDGIPIDAVLIAGDVYDRAVPPVESVTLLGDVLAELVRHTTVIVIGGNHDSAIRLGFGSALFGDRLHVRTLLSSVGTPVAVGELLIYPLPYLDPDVARFELGGNEPLQRSHQAVLGAAMSRVRADLEQRGPGVRSVVMAHLFVANAMASESERPIAVGGVDSVSAATFEGIDYVALGHLHGAQQPTSAGAAVLGYSGSPLRYSFSERNHTKSVTLVDLPPAGAATCTQVPLTQPRAMADLTGDLHELLAAGRYGEHSDSWVRVTVTDRSRPERMYERLRSRFPHLLQALHVPSELLEHAASAALSHTERDPADLAADFVRYVTRLEIDGAELALFEDAFERATSAGA